MGATDGILGAVYRKEMAVLERATPGDVNVLDEDGRTPLMHAILAEDADPDVIRLLIARGARVDVADHGENWTALHYAARDQNAEIVRILLDAGAAVDPVDVYGNTPLWRSQRSSAERGVARLLVEGGADPFKKNRYGVAPIDLARTKRWDDVVKLFEGAQRHNP